ncbi:MAG: ChaN family lipoprotein [Crocinitomicaceae bacterium]
MKTIILSSFLFTLQWFFAQDLPAYQIYNSKGKAVSFEKMAAATNDIDLVLFGEFHDNPIAHWLQLELTQRMYDVHQGKLQLGFEMFEQDQQVLLDAYLAGKLSDEQFKDTLRLWPNYSTDYAPLVAFAKEKNLSCVASNIQRKYASLLFKKGRAALDTLPESIKAQMAPLDFKFDTTLTQYQAMKAMGAHMGPGAGWRMVEAQAIKDATMAHFILYNLWRKPQTVHLHFNGAYHSDFYQGIMWYVLQDRPEHKILTISTVSQDNIKKLDAEHLGRADFIICVPSNMTSTH